MVESGKRVGRSACELILVLAAGAALASEPPDSGVNPVSGDVEVTDSFLGPAGWDVRHVVEHGNGRGREVTVLSSDPEGDLAPRLAISGQGRAWVAWWRSGSVPSVHLRQRGPSGWGPELLVSALGQGAVRPEVVAHGEVAWVAHAVPGTGGTEIAVRSITDVPDPVGGATIGWTPREEALDLTLQSEAGHLWATWAFEGASVAWSERDPATGTWTAPAVDSGEGGAAATWERIRDLVLAP